MILWPTGLCFCPSPEVRDFSNGGNLFENNSREGAKRYRVSKGFLCALASLRDAEGIFRAKPVDVYVLS
jgi:hypothetical protein